MKTLRLRTPFSGAALAAAASMALHAGAPTSGFEPLCTAVGTAGPDLRPVDADSTLGPWLAGPAAPLPEPATAGIGGPPRLVPVTDFVRAPAPATATAGATMDLLRRRLEAVRGSLDDVERQLARIEATLQRLETVQGALTPAAPPRRGDTARAPGAACAGNGVAIGRDRFAGDMQPALFSDLTAAGPAVLDFEAAPLAAGEMGPPEPARPAAPAGSAKAGWLPSGRLVELFLQSAAIAFLATVLLLPIACWLTTGAMSRRARRRGAAAASG